jgi:hypothetical protein
VNFFETLKEKRGGLPTWAWALVFVAILALYLKHKKSTGSAATQASTNAAAQQSASDLGSAANLANLFNVAGLMPYQGGDTFVNTTQTVTPPAPPTPTTPNPIPSPNNYRPPSPGYGGPDVYSASGKDLGPYLYGQQQIHFIQQNLGKYGYTQAILNDVTAAYNAAMKKNGSAAANNYHYTWYKKGNVSAVPRNAPGSTPILNNLP